MSKYGEKCFLIFLAIAFCLLLFTRYNYRHIPFERDEGEYAYAGSLLLHGHYPYNDAYNMKFPGSYFMYALLMKAGGENIEAVRVGVCFLILLTAFGAGAIVYLLTKNFAAAALSSVILIALTNTMGGEGLMANSEHFVNLFAVFGILFLFLFLEGNSRLWLLFTSGIMLACAVIMKQYGYPFGAFAGIVLLAHVWGKPVRYGIKLIAVFSAGIIVPVMLLLAWILYNGLWDKFIFLTVDYAFAYLGLSRGNVGKSLGKICGSAVSIWAVVAISLAILLLLFRQKNARVLLGWILFSILALSTGYYFRVHYFILAYPALAVIVAYAYYEAERRYVFTGKVVVALSLILFFVLQRDEQFAKNPVEVFKQHYPWSMFAGMPEVAKYANSLIAEGDKLSMFSNDPEVYFYSGRIAASGYIYNYPLFECQKYSRQMTQEYIRQIEQNPSPLFVYHSGALEVCNHESYTEFENWRNNYIHNFNLHAVYRPTSETSGAFLDATQLKTDSSWRNGLRIEFWMRKE